MKIAVDAMGGDYAPEAIVKGVMLAREKFNDIEFQLYGKYGLQAVGSHWITNRQIEAARIAMTRYMKRGGAPKLRLNNRLPIPYSLREL